MSHQIQKVNWVDHADTLGTIASNASSPLGIPCEICVCMVSARTNLSIQNWRYYYDEQIQILKLIFDSSHSSIFRDVATTMAPCKLRIHATSCHATLSFSLLL